MFEYTPKNIDRLIKAADAAYADIKFLIALLPEDLQEVAKPQKDRLIELDKALKKLFA